MGISSFVIVLCVTILALHIPFDQVAAAPQLPAGQAPTSDPLEDPPTPFQPRRQRDEAEEDRLHAAALYAAAHLYERNEDYDKALHNYQRAARYDPDNVRLLKDVIDLGRYLDRHTQIARYAVLAAPLDASDTLNVLRAFVYLREEGDLKRALELYETAAKRAKSSDREPAWIELHKLAGEAYLLAGDHRRAADVLGIVDRALQQSNKLGFDEETVKLLEGSNAEALHTFIGRAYLKAGLYEKASAAFERAERADPNPGRRLHYAAQIHAAAGRRDEALKALDEYFALKLTSQGDDPYQLLADLLAKGEPPGDLIAKLEAEQKNDPDNATLAYFLSRQYVKADRLNDARRLIEQQLPQHPEGFAYRNLLDILRQTKDADAFLETCGELAERLGSLAILGPQQAAAAEDTDFMKALEAVARRRLADKPTSLPFGQRLAVAQLAATARQFELADEFYELALKSAGEKRAVVYEAWGLELLVAERFADAAKVFQRAIDAKVLPADQPTFHFYLSGALAMAERFDEAIAVARHAIKARDDSAEYRQRLAWILYRDDRRDEAIEAYKQLIEKFDPEHSSSQVRDVVREARLTLSHLYTLRDDIPRAVELIEQVLDEFPEDVGAMNDLGYLWADQGVHLNRALRMTQAACKAEPDNAAYRDSLGWVLYRLGRYENALTELKQAVATYNQTGEEAGSEDDPVEGPDGVILDHLGDVYAKLGQRDAAIESWTAALAAFEKADDEKMAATVRAKLTNHDPTQPVQKDGTAPDQPDSEQNDAGQ